ncbi:MAG: PD-(D/E)XK nuclease family protein [Bacteroidales bacterium]|nr:PD-(D/E)XK nuclease family protein [Bacteroidales bacterium]
MAGATLQNELTMDFLEKVAYSLRERHGSEMERQTVVLPSRRAGLWLARALARLNDKPSWAPSMLTVSDLFRSFTSLVPADTETQIFELWNVYRKQFGEEMSFDDFWPWGEVIINDFNDIDLYMADAGKLYSNISDLKEIDDRFGGLTDEQVEIIRGFWKSFNPGATTSDARSRFRSVWQKLGPLYVQYRKAMFDRGMAGDGMLCREVAEQALNGTLKVPEGRRWHIAGLNALNNCEKTLFIHLRKLGVADFYWDDDHFFMDDPEHKASLFIRENIRIFGNRAGRGEDGPHRPPSGEWQIIDTPSDTAQAGMVAQLLGNEVIAGDDDPTSTAIILADEKLLMPVLGSIPSSVDDVNVTMGHPFRFTPLYSFLKQLMSLIRSARTGSGEVTFRSDDFIALLGHQYFRLLTGSDGETVIREIIRGNMLRVSAAMLTARFRIKELFLVPTDGSAIPEHLAAVMGQLEEATFAAEEEGMTLSTDREYLRAAMNSTTRLANLIRSYNPGMKPETGLRLLDRVFRKMIVPFSGEPLRGIQVMGALETRALEFKRIIFLSLNEGIFPAISYDNTYIPYNIRRAFGLPTVNEHESIWSYYFFRLLRKPEKGWFLYNSSAQGLNSGEMSRYLVRMSYSPEFAPVHRSVHISVGRSRMISETLQKTEAHNRTLVSIYGESDEERKYLSPSAVNTWLNCRMRFYYRYVCGMPEEEMLEKEIDQRRFGNIMHDALRRLYEPLKGIAGAGPHIAAMAGNRHQVRETIIAAAMDEMRWDRETLLSGRGMIIIDVLERYARELLDYDAQNPDLTILSLENELSGTHTVTTAGSLKIRLGGKADRIDLTGGAVRVVDYKTGTPKKEAISAEGLFDEEKEKRSDAILQALLYCTLIEDKHPGRIVLPSIYWIQQLSSDEFSPYSGVKGLDGPDAGREEWRGFMNAFRHEMGLTLDRIFAVNEDFRMTPFRRRCTSCPYRTLCRR